MEYVDGQTPSQYNDGQTPSQITEGQTPSQYTDGPAPSRFTEGKTPSPRHTVPVPSSESTYSNDEEHWQRDTLQEDIPTQDGAQTTDGAGPRRRRPSLADFGIDPNEDRDEDNIDTLETAIADIEEEVSIPGIHIEVGEDIEENTPPISARIVSNPPGSKPPPVDNRFTDLNRTTQVASRDPKEWWQVFFDDDYIYSVKPAPPNVVRKQVDFIERSLALESGATVIDVGCGFGVHAIELSKRGYNMVAMDISLSMLSYAADEAQAAKQRINFIHADMTRMSFHQVFDGMLCLGTTLGYFSDEQNKQQLRRFANALKPEGVLILDIVNRDHVARQQPHLVWFEGDGCVCMEETQFNYLTSRLHVKRTLVLEDGRQRDTEYAVRLYSLHEIGHMLSDAGFRVTELSGMEETPGTLFGNESPRIIAVARKR